MHVEFTLDSADPPDDRHNQPDDSWERFTVAVLRQSRVGGRPRDISRTGDLPI